jgi:hypothetical protein
MPYPTLAGASVRSGFATALVLALVLLTSMAWLSQQPHAVPVRDGRPASGFMAVRAMTHVEALAQAPRPTGSAANASARDYILAQVRALGLAPEVQTETVRTASADMMANVRVTLAEVHNIVVRKPGSRPAKDKPGAILASAHYDSGPATLGAADGAMSAAALLETLRVLQAGPPLANDLVFVFTDADSGQALGTQGFLASSPWARKARFLLRFDNPGNRGPLALVGGAGADGVALAAYARAAPDPAGSSFMAELYTGPRARPADAPLLAHHASLLQFATVGGKLGPGAVHDLPQRVSQASLQHEGDTMLAMLRDLGQAAPAPQGGRGQVFFSLPGVGVVHYAYALVWPLTALACVLTVLACAAAMRRRSIVDTDIIHAAFGFLFMGALATFVVHLCYLALPGLPRRWDAGMLAGDEGIRWQVLAFALLLAAAFLVLLRHLQQKHGSLCMLLGVFCVATLALVVVSWGAPGASYLLAWPLLAAQAAVLALLSARAEAWTGRRKRGVLALAALPALLLVLPALRDTLTMVSPAWLVLPAALVCTLLGLCGLLLADAGKRYVVRPLLLAAAAAIGLVYISNPQVPEMPVQNGLVYFKDTPSWRAFWLYPPRALDAWTRSIFPNTLHPYQLPYLFGASAGPVWYAAAPRDTGVAYPELIIDKVEWRGDTKHVEFLLRSKNRAPHISLRVDGADPMRASVNGRLLTGPGYRGWRLDLHGMQDRELRFAFDFWGDPKFTVYVQEIIPGLPQRELPPRPATLRPALLPLTGTTISADILRFE